MGAALVGEMSLGVLNPAVELALAPAGAQLTGNVTAALSLQASLDVAFPTLAVQLDTLINVTIPSLQAGIALGLPGVTFSASAAAALVAKAELALGNLKILIGLLSGGSVFVYSFSGGTVSTIGSDLATAIAAQPPPGLSSGSGASGILIGASPGAWSTVSAYFGGL